MRYLIIILLALQFIDLSAQGSFIRTGNTVGDKFHVASLPKNNSSNYHKLRIEILGGSWYDWSLGTRTYTISSRSYNTENPIRIHHELRGGSTSNYMLKVYETKDSYDFIIETTTSYASIFVQAYLTQAETNGITQNSIQEVKSYVVGSNLDITNKVRFVHISFTDDNGNIGIGTPAPQAKLDVRGKIIANEVEIKALSGADFVFKPDYNLMPLAEVETFVKENQHLPEIPSEKQMIENGLNVNEMQIKLLQKIEELTLYVIELEKQNKNLQHQVNQQNNRIEQLESK